MLESIGLGWRAEARVPDGYSCGGCDVEGVVEYLMANPILLAPLLLLVSVGIYALLKKLLKVAVIILIAGALYLVLMNYMGSGV